MIKFRTIEELKTQIKQFIDITITMGLSQI